MARFEDYVKQQAQNDEIDKEIEQAGTQSAERREDGVAIPERFKGKTPEEIAQSYVELEKFNSRQAQDLGRLRKTVDEMLELQLRDSGPGRDKPNTKPVEASDLLDRPDETVRGIAKQEVDARVQNLEAQLHVERIERKKAEFAKLFPTWEDDVKDPAFLNWVREKQHRMALAQQADQTGDWSAAETLLGTYYDQKETQKARQTKSDRKAAIKEVTLESSGAGVPDLDEKYSRSALMEKRIRARRGDRAAQTWLNGHAEAIAIAYEEGRLVD